MPYFSLKMRQIQFRLRLRPRWGAHSALPDPLAGIGVKGRKGERVRGKGESRSRIQGGEWKMERVRARVICSMKLRG